MKICYRPHCIFALLFVLLTTSSLCGQNSAPNIVMLKSGQTVHGTIIERVEGQHIILLTTDSINLTIKFSQIQKIDGIGVSASQETPSQGPTPVGAPIEAAYILEGSVGLLLTSGSSGQFTIGAAAGLSAIIGGKLGSQGVIGMGIGFERASSIYYLPIFMNLRYRFNDNLVSPIFIGSGGYAYIPDYLYTIGGYTYKIDLSGGYYLDGALCLDYRASENISIQVGGGARLVNMGIVSKSPVTGNKEREDLNVAFFIFRSGITF
jgi:hypothetical protein